MSVNGFSAAALAAVLMLGATGASAAVNVTFVNPETYRDDDFRSASKRPSVIADLTRHIERLDERYLKPGQRLDIKVIDARLAGRYEPWRPHLNDVRILRDTTPPRFEIRYVLRQGGKVITTGEEIVSDMNYLANPSARNSSNRLVHEKEMLSDWFRQRFVQLIAPRR